MSNIDENTLNNLGPGCYVKVEQNGQCFWAEITQVDADQVLGKVRPELSTGQCQHKAGLVNAKFNLKQVTDLGCDNYCFC